MEGHPPAAFIGVDAPDFNLGVECRMRAAGVPTVHYVSPTVWAWRTRVRKIRRAVDLLLTIFPFETRFLDRYQVPSHYVGHPWPATCRCSLTALWRARRSVSTRTPGAGNVAGKPARRGRSPRPAVH